MMLRGFARHVQSLPRRPLPHCGNRVDFRVRAAELFVMPFADEFSLCVDDHGADLWIRLHTPGAPSGNFQCTPHHVFGVGE